MCIRRQFLIITALLLETTPAAAQPIVELKNRDSCETCRIQMRRITTIGDTAGPGVVDGVDVIWARDSRGRYYHSGYHIGPEIRVFDASGRFVQLLGRQGTGPGEFDGRSPLFVGRGDTIHVFNWGNSSYTAFDSSLRLVRSTSTAAIPNSVIESPDGSFVAAARLRSREGIGFPLHRISRSGEYVSSFGSTDPYVGVTNAFLWRHLAVDEGGRSFVSLHRYRIAVEEWDWRGNLIRTLTLAAPWFAPVKPTSGPPLPLDGSSPMPAVVVGGRIDADRLLWLICNIPDRNWQDAFHDHGRPGPHGIEPSPVHLWDSMIVVIDLNTNQVVKRARSDRWIGGFIGPDVFANVEDASGNPRAEIWSLHLIR